MADTKENAARGGAIFEQYARVNRLTKIEISSLKNEMDGHRIKDIFGRNGPQNEKDVDIYKSILKLCIDKQILNRAPKNESIRTSRVH